MFAVVFTDKGRSAGFSLTRNRQSRPKTSSLEWEDALEQVYSLKTVILLMKDFMSCK